MHFWLSTARLYGRVPAPRKTSLNWFMPALVNSSVGSSSGTTLDDGTKVWPCFLQKKSMNCWRISVEVSMVVRIVEDLRSWNEWNVQWAMIILPAVRGDGSKNNHHQLEEQHREHEKEWQAHSNGEQRKINACEAEEWNGQQVIDRRAELKIERLPRMPGSQRLAVGLNEIDNQRGQEPGKSSSPVNDHADQPVLRGMPRGFAVDFGILSQRNR